MAEVEMESTLHIVHEPKVYLLAGRSSTTRRSERFFSDHEVSKWTTDTKVGGEKSMRRPGASATCRFKSRAGG